MLHPSSPVRYGANVRSVSWFMVLFPELVDSCPYVIGNVVLTHGSFSLLTVNCLVACELAVSARSIRALTSIKKFLILLEMRFWSFPSEDDDFTSICLNNYSKYNFSGFFIHVFKKDTRKEL